MKDSHYVPKQECDTPIATWKRVNEVQDVLRDHELKQVEKAGGSIPVEEWIGYIQSGDERA